MDETACGGRTQHRAFEGGTQVGAQPVEGRCRRCVQYHSECRGDELPKAPESFLAQFSAQPAARLGLDSGPTSATPPPHSVGKCLKSLFQDRLIYLTLY